MKFRSFLLAALAVLVAVGVAPISPGNFAVGMSSAGGGDVAAFKAALQEDGFIVQEGLLENFNIIAACCAGLAPSCFANNATAPYMVYSLPPAPGQTTASAFPWTYRIAPDEAIVYIGTTPPPTAYFSHQTFLLQKYFENEGARRRVFATFGDTLNLRTMRTGGTAADPFGKAVMIVTTADRGIDARVRAAARAAGYSTEIMNTDVLPSAVLPLGLDDRAGEFVHIQRVYLPVQGYEAALDEYIRTPQLVLRVTPAEPGARDPYPTPELRVRGTGRTEMDLMPAVEELRRAILAKYGDLKATELTTSVWLPDGFDGLQRGIDTLGPTRDALYLWSKPNFTLLDGPDDFLIVYGVNHEATRKATYSNLAVYADETLLLGINSVHSRTLAGSARDYIPDHPQADYLYTWKITRDCCGDPHCLEVKLDNCAALNLDTLPDMWLGFRLYLEPESNVGPAFAEVIYDRAILFSSD
jgi:hypothetical protein